MERIIRNRVLVLAAMILLFAAKNVNAQATDSTDRYAYFGIYGMFGYSQPVRIDNYGLQLLRSAPAPYYEVGISYEHPIGKRWAVELDAGVGILQSIFTSYYTLTGIAPTRNDRLAEGNRERTATGAPIGFVLLTKYKLKPIYKSAVLSGGIAVLYHEKFQGEYGYERIRGANLPNDHFSLFLLQEHSFWRISPQAGIDWPLTVFGRYMTLGMTVRYTFRPIGIGNYIFYNNTYPSLGTVDVRYNFAAIRLKYVFRKDSRNTGKQIRAADYQEKLPHKEFAK